MVEQVEQTVGIQVDKLVVLVVVQKVVTEVLVLVRPIKVSVEEHFLEVQKKVVKVVEVLVQLVVQDKHITEVLVEMG